MASPKMPAPSRASFLVYDFMLWFWRLIINIFFREIRPRGAYNIPRDGPVIFAAAPHSNQFLDPLLLSSEVYRETHRRVEHLAAAASMRRKFVGFFIRLMRSIPVARAADESKVGSGRVTLSPDDPCLVIGHGTRFLTEFAPKSQITLAKSTGSLIAEVAEVLSDTELRIKKEFGGESGKGTAKAREKIAEAQAQGLDGLEYKRMPFIDQQEMYRFVYQRLKEGGCIGIFPEGGSHDRTDLLPLKAGVAIMALGAMANHPSLRVRIVPVGLSYFHAHRFRSRAVIEFGTAMDVPPELVQMFKEGGPKKREACSKLLDLIYSGLKTVTLRAPDYDTLMVVQAARRLYEVPGQHLSLGRVVELNRRFLEAYQHFHTDPRVQRLRENVLKYNRLLRDLGLRDHQVPRAKKASWRLLGLFLYRLILLIFWGILALPGVVLNGPIFILASVISRKKAKQALAASSVKVAGRDVLATWKVLISLGVAPVLYASYAVLATFIAIKANLPMAWRIWAPIVSIIVLPIMSYAALKFGEAGVDILKSLRPLIIALVPGQQKLLIKLKRMRTSLSAELTELTNELGPQLWDDFDTWRMLVPSDRHGIWRRRSDADEVAFDIHSSLLAHPMTWLDEHLFGWSRSSKRGTSAWAGFGSADTSRYPSPDGSDSEEFGDYDSYMRYLPTDSGEQSPVRFRSRSLRGSYADLQQLKVTPVVPGGPRSAPAVSSEETGLHFRQGHRERRSSLNDGVAVERLSALDPQASFEEATEDINRENDLHRLQDSHPLHEKST